MDVFDPIKTSLDGSHLLEASAGTGKTYSLSFIYLRLLLEKNFLVEQIVVATFTKPATAELKQRIYARLFEAEFVLKKIINNEPYDSSDILYQWLNKIRNNNGDDVLLNRLRLAQSQFDRSHIHSINGFALHILHENTVTLGQTMPEEVLNDDADLIKDIYLRLVKNNFKELGDKAKDIGEAVSTLDSKELFRLLSSMQDNYKLLKNAELHFPDIKTKKQDFDNTVNFILDNKDNLNTSIDAIISAIEAGFLNKQSYKINKINNIRNILKSKNSYHSDDVDIFKILSQDNLLAKRTKRGQENNINFDNPIFIAFSNLYDLAPTVKQANNINFYMSLMSLLDCIRKYIHIEKANKMALTHDDIVNIVASGADSLDLDFKAALLDEAQDTNALQLQLFESLFLKRGHICFFVGDPKQAIYGFRGGDVYTYLKIKDKVKNIHRLPKNYRSSQSINESINSLFISNPFSGQRIDYNNIEWDISNDSSDFSGNSLSTVTPSGKTVGDIANSTAYYIDRLLSYNHKIKDGKNIRVLRGSDIAILTRSANQALQIKKSLTQRGLVASYTGKNSIYTSNEAILMYGLLNAISSGQLQHIKSLMITVLFNYDNSDLLNDDIVNALRQKLHNYSDIYSKNGFAMMFYCFMHDYNVGGRLLQQSDGKRSLSNWIQLFELLQKALQKQSLTLIALNDWLVRNIRNPDNEIQLRLEDQDAISIMTVHSSKGLEFKVVCLPYINYQPTKPRGKNDILVSHSKKLAILSSIGIDEIDKYCTDESDAEDMRLAYVALTRASYHNIVIEQSKDGRNASRDNSSWSRLKKELNKPIDEYDFCTVDAITEEDINKDNGVINKSANSKGFNIKHIEKELYPKWLMTSFSGLQQRISYKKDLNILKPTIKDDKEKQDSKSSVLMSFPIGAKAGTILHSLYENYMSIRQCNSDFINYTEKELSISRLKLSTDIKLLSSRLAKSIADTANVNLFPQSFCLNDIDINEQSIEMAFFLYLNPHERQHLYKYFGEFISDKIDGYLHGFIDYWFYHEDKFYILDYKSNKLGQSTGDYSRNSMQQAMIEHHYDLQALIYTLALCKHLGISNEGDYKKIGGYYYLFIRGMSVNNKDNPDNGIYYNRVDWELLSPLLNNNNICNDE